ARAASPDPGQMKVLDQLEQVAQLVLFGFEIFARALGGMDLQRNALDDLEAVAADRHVLGGVIRHQSHPANPEIPQDLAADSVVSDVGWESELLIGRDGVVPLVLQLVGFQLVDEADAPSLLKQIEKDSLAGLGDFLQSELELRATVAPERSKHVACQTL